LWLVKADVEAERRTVAPSADARARPSSTGAANGAGRALAADAGALGTGLVYLPHAAEGRPRYVLVAERYGGLAPARAGAPMLELIAGADLEAPDAPVRLTFTAADRGVSRLAVRYRQFPGFHRWLVIVGHRLEAASGLLLELTYPTQALIGYRDPTNAWRVYAAARADGRAMPTRSLDTTGWLEGYAGSLLVGGRVRVAGPLNATVEVGREREHLVYLDEHGETLRRQHTAWAPTARAAIELWLP
jgi:hypothetical protein